jgi:hypothetical protein
VGFEVKNPDAFCKAFEAKDIKTASALQEKRRSHEQHRYCDDCRPLGSLNRVDRGTGQDQPTSLLNARQLLGSNPV